MDLPQRLEEFDWMEVSPFFKDALRLSTMCPFRLRFADLLWICCGHAMMLRFALNFECDEYSHPRYASIPVKVC